MAGGKGRMLALASAVTLACAGMAHADWGAVGFDSNGTRVAWSHDYGNEAGAYNRVWSECGGYCDQIFTFYNQCGAIARASSGAWGWSLGGSRGAAESGAVGYCRQYGGRDCRVVVWACSG